MSKLRKGMMKLSKPIVFKNIFNIFDDNRGFLSTLDIQKLLNKIPDSKFNFAYQLLSFSEKKHTFRGMHYQEKPFAQNKLILVHQGTIIDLVIDLDDKEIDTVLRFEITAGDAILVPKNYAHGFVSLTDNVLMQYFMDNKFSQEDYKGFNITSYLETEFPELDLIISDKDRNLISHKS